MQRARLFHRYWPLFELLSPEAAENVSWRNAYNEYFKDWQVPSGSGGGRYARTEAFYHCESLDPTMGEFVVGASDVDTNGMY